MKNLVFTSLVLMFHKNKLSTAFFLLIENHFISIVMKEYIIYSLYYYTIYYNITHNILYSILLLRNIFYLIKK